MNTIYFFIYFHLIKKPGIVSTILVLLGFTFKIFLQYSKCVMKYVMYVMLFCIYLDTVREFLRYSHSKFSDIACTAYIFSLLNYR